MPAEFTHTEQNYIKAIYHLSKNENGMAYTQQVADAMTTTAASASDMIKKLSEKGLLSYVPYRGAKLNRKGEKTALHIIRRHRLWELFLTEVLHFKWNEVHEMAEELEHVSSDLLLDRIDRYLNFPKYDPHGDPIPDATGKIAESDFIRLSDLQKNQSGIIAAVENHSNDFLKYLDETGMTLNCNVKVIQTHAFDASMDLMVNQKKNIHVSNQVAQSILIKK